MQRNASVEEVVIIILTLYHKHKHGSVEVFKILNKNNQNKHEVEKRNIIKLRV